MYKSLYKDLFLILFLTFIFSFFGNTKVFADRYPCGSPQCPCNGPGEYCCNGGNMCCTGGGCPSYVCNNQTYTSAQNCGGTWTCCIAGYGCLYCGGSAYYNNLGTCGYCPTIPDDPPPPSCGSNPSSPALQTPSDAATFASGTNITFSWSAADFRNNCDGDSYRLQVDNNSDFSSPTINTTYGPSTLSVANIISYLPGTYYWRVLAINERGSTVSTPSRRSFIISNTAPTVTRITGPGVVHNKNYAQGLTSNFVGTYNVEYADTDGQRVATTWSSSCPFTHERVSRVIINTRGVYGSSAWPELRVVTGNQSGARATPCTYTINNTSYQNKICTIDQTIASLDILFANGATGRELFVNYIMLEFADRSRITLQAEAVDNNGVKVLFDRGTHALTAYDGMSMLNGREQLTTGGSLRFPVPLSFSPTTVPTTCRLTATVTDTLGATATLDRNITVCAKPPAAVTNPSPTNNADDVPLPPTLSWDATSDWGNACGGTSRTYNVYATINPSMGSTCPNPDPTHLAGDPYRLLPECAGKTDSNRSCQPSYMDVRNTEFCWYVEANNGIFVTPSATSGSGVWHFVTEDPLLYQNWISIIGGDFYTGSYSVEYPNFVDQVAPWTPVHTVYEEPSTPNDASLISSGLLDIRHNNATQGYIPEAESELYAKFTNYVNTWPANYTGAPPANAISLPLGSDSCDEIFTGSNKLDPFEVYEADVSCMEDAVNAVASLANGYELDNDGYAVIYVTGSGEFRFNSAFTTNNDAYRVVFVAGPDVSIKVDRGLSIAGNPDFSSSPVIEAAFVVTGNFEFEGVNTTGADPETDPDNTIVVEGPIIAKSIGFSRNRGSTNFFPSEVVKYNSSYIYNLTEAERNSLKSNGAGLFVIDIDWVKED